MALATDPALYTAPNGATFATIGDALHAAYWGDIGTDGRPVTLTRPGYTTTTIAPGGRGPTGWYVREIGERLPRTRS